MANGNTGSSVADLIPDVSPESKGEPLTDKALEEGEGPSLEQQKFTLEQEKVRAKLAHNHTEFTPLMWAKFSAVFIALLYVAALATSLVIFIWHGDKAIHDWHVLVALVSGAYLSIFAVLAILTKGLFSKEKDETPPITLAEVLKAITEVFKATKAK